MTKTLNEMMKRLPARRRRKVEARAKELIAEEMTLRDLRKANDLTQNRMAAILDIGQDSVSRIEQRSDLLLSTLQNYVAAMGGSLEVVARFPDRPSVVVMGLHGLQAAGFTAKTTRRRVAAKKAKASAKHASLGRA
jgi:transcriptional regulator with XRE-family HTH domain